MDLEQSERCGDRGAQELSGAGAHVRRVLVERILRDGLTSVQQVVEPDPFEKQVVRLGVHEPVDVIGRNALPRQPISQTHIVRETGQCGDPVQQVVARLAVGGRW